MKIRRVALNATPALQGAVQQPGNAFLAAATPIANAIGLLASDQAQKLEARARQKSDLDFLQAASSYERGLGEIDMPEGGDGYAPLADEVFKSTFGHLETTAPDHMREDVIARVRQVGIRMSEQAIQRSEREAISKSVFDLEQGLEAITGEAARNPSAIEALRTKGNDLLSGNPDLSPDQRRAAVDAFNDDLNERSEMSRVENDPVARAAYLGNSPAALDAFKASLAHTESGGRYGVQNDEGFVGKYQFGQPRLNDFYRATGRKAVSMEEFRLNPQLQEQAMDWHTGDIDNFIVKNGLDKHIGSEIGGVIMTQNGLRAMAHLGGKGGMKKFLDSGGKSNPADSNGTSLLGYARTHAMSGKLGAKSYGRVSSAAQKIVRAEAKAKLAEKASIGADLSVGVSRGETTYIDLDEARSNASITDAKWAELTKGLDSYHNKERASDEAITMLTDVLDRGEKGNPHDSDHRKAAEKIDEGLIDRVDREDLPEARVKIATETGVASSGHVADLTNRVNQGDPAAFDEISRIKSRSPQAFNVPSGSFLRKKSDEYDTYTRAGLSSEDAAKAVSPTAEEALKRSALAPEIKKELKSVGADDVVQALDSWLPFDQPDLSSHNRLNLDRDFRTIYTVAREGGMPPKIAKEHAVKTLIDGGLYGVSEYAAGGMRKNLRTKNSTLTTDSGLMRLPPERFYPVIDGSHEYIGDDIRDSLGTLDNYSKGDWFLMTDERETSEYARKIANGQTTEMPGYILAYEDKEGVIQTTYWRMEPEEIQGKQVEITAAAKAKVARGAAELAGVREVRQQNKADRREQASRKNSIVPFQ